MIFPEEKKLLCVTFKEMGYAQLRYRVKGDFGKKKALFVIVDLLSNAVKYEVICLGSKHKENDEKHEYHCFSSAIHHYNQI
ncbi:MAG: hypothetical protein ACFFDY_00265 [Candidatus Thorarchaeota archaeon]